VHYRSADHDIVSDVRRRSLDVEPMHCIEKRVKVARIHVRNSPCKEHPI
jgi:hypothetical protein